MVNSVSLSQNSTGITSLRVIFPKAKYPNWEVFSLSVIIQIQLWFTMTICIVGVIKQIYIISWLYVITIHKRVTFFLFILTMKFDGWPWNTMGHLFYATSSFVHHFTTISELKFELQSGNARFQSNWVIFGLMWPWNLMGDLEKQ